MRWEQSGGWKREWTRKKKRLPCLSYQVSPGLSQLHWFCLQHAWFILGIILALFSLVFMPFCCKCPIISVMTRSLSCLTIFFFTTVCNQQAQQRISNHVCSGNTNIQDIHMKDRIFNPILLWHNERETKQLQLKRLVHAKIKQEKGQIPSHLCTNTG